MKLTHWLIIVIFLFHLIHDTTSSPIPQTQPNFPDYEIEDRRIKNKRKRRPCTRNTQGDSRWFFGHDLTLFLGDVTICGNIPHQGGSNSEDDTSGGIFGGVVPVLQKPIHKPHRPFKPFNKPNRPGNNIKPVNEVVEEDYVQDNYYKPGPLVGALSNQVQGLPQNLSNFMPTRIISTISRHINNIVNPFIDLFYK